MTQIHPFPVWLRGLALAAALCATAAQAAPATNLSLKPCRLKGVEHEARCGVLKRPLNPAQPQGPQIDVHVAVLPAVARVKKPDPVVFFAGGPGQSAIDLAGSISQLMSRFSNRRDLVLIDQRGTGRSAPLKCAEQSPGEPLAHSLSMERQKALWQDCLKTLKALPHGDLRYYTTSIAMADADAVRAALGYEQVNIVGASYGTRAVLEYMRLFPQRVRRAVLDGVAPPDMVLPATFAVDAQAAMDKLLTDCEADTRCSALYPRLRADWKGLLAAMPQEARILHPVTGREEVLTLTRDHLTQWARVPHYSPTLASGLPFAITEAKAGRWTPLVGLVSAMTGPRGLGLAMGMHFAVVCAEDMPRLPSAAAAATDFGDGTVRQYQEACADVTAGTPPPGFYTLPPATVPALLLSGGADPATPPRHGERVGKALGGLARHVVVPQAGHGTLSLGCVRDAVFRFVDAESATTALEEASTAKGAACADKMPRPPAFAPIQPRAVSASSNTATAGGAR
ncbi:MAG: cysteine protease [Ideonella sp. MAG2]|nr:MAG: cysteine protease [Ideonella sp. MAG2]